MTDLLHVFVTKSVKFGRTEVSIPPIDAKFQDLSIQRVVKGWFLIFGGEKSIFHQLFGWFVKEKKRFRHEIRSYQIKVVEAVLLVSLRNDDKEKVLVWCYHDFLFARPHSKESKFV